MVLIGKKSSSCINPGNMNKLCSAVAVVSLTLTDRRVVTPNYDYSYLPVPRSALLAQHRLRGHENQFLLLLVHY